MCRRIVFLLIFAVLLLAACSNPSQTSPTPAPSAATVGNAANGDKLFHSATLGKDKVPGCATCHSTEKGKTVVGPALAAIFEDAGDTVKEKDYGGTAKSAEEWLRESIVNPNVDVAQDFQPNVMPQNYKTELTEQEINDLVAYLATLK